MFKTDAVTSIKDPHVVEARELASATGRKYKQKCLLEGLESIQWAQEARLPIEYIFYHNTISNDQLASSLGEMHSPCYAVTDGILKKISDTSYLIPYIGVARLPAERSPEDTMGGMIIVLDHVVDHGNIGTIIRTASAFGVRDIVSTNLDLDIYYKKIVTASRGKAFEAQVQHFPTGMQAIAALKHLGYQIVATSPHAKDLQALAPLQAKPVALIVGNETQGITDEIERLADVVVQIPMSGQVESLNVGVSTGISLYEIKFRMVLSMLVNYIRANTGREVTVTGKMIMQAFDTQMQKVSHLNGLQVLLLMILKCDQQMSMTQVARDMGTFGEELAVLLEPLFTKAYIQYTPSADMQMLQLTPEGERTLAQLWNVVERAENQALTGFSEPEKKQLNDFLQRIQANCTALVDA